ncbi:hypothetical protein [Heliophilum fasciatum]|uniref:Flagellar hook-length control protein FliK n=1 Tax=Heliophilum fasciatum TaxID=35700 RepID=A0A4R2RAN3_9FIRM|nr:hypothetical protein [Heliophilum fasciatum]MCW2279459.1 hypothetical protein [Heliophilum fasciatum]TCP59783.1 hypothetical protein EDD73_1481 [Heliophilum fasciatum]
MKITPNPSVGGGFAVQETPADLQRGQIYNATIKKVTPPDTAVVQIRDHEFSVQIEGELPRGARANLQITDTSGPLPKARVLPPSDQLPSGGASGGTAIGSGSTTAGSAIAGRGSATQSSAAALLRQLNVPATGELTPIVQHLLDRGRPVDRATATALHQFVTQAPGTIEQKKEVIQALLQKQLPLTSETLQAVREALHGRNLNRVLNDIVKELNNQATRNDTSGTGSTGGTGNPANATSLTAVENYLAQLEQSLGTGLLPTKDIMITSVSQRLMETAEQFRGMKREITRNLDILEQISRNQRTFILPTVKPLLEKTIDMLDQGILKSNITLFTDMDTEKLLMQASSQLATAKALLAKGDNAAAAEIVNRIKESLQQLSFKPSEVKVRHLLTNGTAGIPTPSPTLVDMPTAAGNRAADSAPVNRGNSPEPSATAAFRLIRALGLNHDSEAAQWIAGQSDGAPSASTGAPQNSLATGTDPNQQPNLKAMLLQLAGSDNPQHQNLRSLADQAVNNLTGQQLLSSNDPLPQSQTAFFSLPLSTNGQGENAKIWIHSRNDRPKMDWENCSIYFLLETKALGDTGIMLTATDRNLSVTVKTDHPEGRNQLEPLFANVKEHLQAIGYTISSFQFTRLQADPANSTSASSSATGAGSSAVNDTMPTGIGTASSSTLTPPPPPRSLSNIPGLNVKI